MISPHFITFLLAYIFLHQVVQGTASKGGLFKVCFSIVEVRYCPSCYRGSNVSLSQFVSGVSSPLHATVVAVVVLQSC